MLVISRSKGESLMIGDDIEIQVVEIRGDKIRLGIICPADTPVHRREVLDAIRRLGENEVQSPPSRPGEP